MITTPRLRLIPATADHLTSELDGASALAASLDVYVPDTWPQRSQECLDPDERRIKIDQIVQEVRSRQGWGLHFIVFASTDAKPCLIGYIGFAGPPSAEGALEVLLGIVSDRRRNGYASEAVQGLLAYAFRSPEVTLVMAETGADNAGSIGVLRKCGFRSVSPTGSSGMRFELSRSEYASVQAA
jgi:ribosomal-protein-alanine N-acetyltransferase